MSKMSRYFFDLTECGSECNPEYRYLGYNDTNEQDTSSEQYDTTIVISNEYFDDVPF